MPLGQHLRWRVLASPLVRRGRLPQPIGLLLRSDSANQTYRSARAAYDRRRRGRVDMVAADVRFMADLRTRLTPIAFREILEAAAGWKVARVPMSPATAIDVVPLLRRNGVGVAVSEHRFVHAKDEGKGGWSNRLARLAHRDENVGDVYVYVGRDERMMIDAAEAESEGDGALFGEALGIPKCCRDAFDGHLQAVIEHQNDPIIVTILGTLSPPPHRPWNNIASQYFGRCLLSYAPCSLDCRASAELARRTHALLEQVAPDEASAVLNAQRLAYVFTDRDGVHRLEGSALDGGILRYDGVSSTLDSPLRRRLLAADGLQVSSIGSAKLQFGNGVMERLNEISRLGIFWGGGLS